MQPRSEQYEARVRELFDRAVFVNDVGIRLLDVGPGWCEAAVELERRHDQQNGFVHAGVVFTLADHTAGAAGGSLIADDEVILTAGVTIHFLRPGAGERLVCRAEVLKPGRRLTVAESEVWAEAEGRRKLIAKASVSLAIVDG